MAEEIRHPDGRIEHPSVRHERSDASFRWVFGIIIAAMVFAAFVHWAILMFFFDYRNKEAKVKESPYPLASTPSTALPPEPRLEELNRRRGESSSAYEREAAKEDVLRSYGPTGEKEFIRIPIERAMNLLADKLPVRKQPPAGRRRRQDGLVDAGESNSGRMFREAPPWYER
jgi:hypothetical protein